VAAATAARPSCRAGTRRASPRFPATQFLDKPLFLAWKTEDNSDRVLDLSAPGVRDQVKTAWKLLKARELAEADAKRIAEDVKALKGDPQGLRSAAGEKYHLPPVYELGPIAKQLPTPQTAAGLTRSYDSFRVPKERIVFPDNGGRGSAEESQFVEGLLKLKDQPIGDDTVLSDPPKQNFYVAVLTRRTEATEGEFDRVFFAGNGDNMLQGFLQQRNMEYRAMVLKQLRQDVGLVVNEKAARGAPQDTE